MTEVRRVVPMTSDGEPQYNTSASLETLQNTCRGLVFSFPPLTPSKPTTHHILPNIPTDKSNAEPELSDYHHAPPQFSFTTTHTHPPKHVFPLQIERRSAIRSSCTSVTTPLFHSRRLPKISHGDRQGRLEGGRQDSIGCGRQGYRRQR